MIIVKLQGGLGNQMFQYAYGRKLALLQNKKLILNTHYLYNADIHTTKRIFDLDIFNLNYDIDNNIEPNLKEFYQSEKYFCDIAEHIKKDFELKKDVNNDIIDLYNDISYNQSVMIHFRRTDYIDSQNVGGIHICPDINQYYYKNVEIIKNKIKSAKFYIFSDDIEWCKENFIIDNCVYIGSEIDQYNKHNSFRLMIKCKHHIIANSTYSWWSAWLSKYENKIIISPKKWYNNGFSDLSNIENTII